ncbi:TetR/AcrR family transcriptional regulator [Miniimonas arenae]|uniref:TetR/AcrR family transcriptional regulator n=1 Tax=Miniimonas arenae TaxID=676201 RepID=A0A5C5BH63_9MICO|nr:TetR/AcrR family transcriptional regulator [Miniimonas arenae]TNU76873.1 TetR/AcrR family transcriptional regulator [Miniimonas arenae]
MSRVDVDAASSTSPAPEPSADGRARRWDTHRATRRDELTRAARRAVHHGGPDLSMDEIATAIGTSKSIVYRYFRDRSGLQAAVGEAVLRDLGAALAEATRGAADPGETVHAMVEVYLAMISTSPAVYQFVTRAGDVGDADAPMRTLADDAAALLVPELEQVLLDSGREGALAHMWAAGVIGFVRGAAEVWLAERASDGALGSPRPAPEDGSPDPALVTLADTITSWICLGTGATPSAVP